MSAATSPGTGLAYGLRRVCAAWGMARSSFYAMTSGQHAEQPPAKRRGPKPAISDQALLVAIEADLEASPWEGEGYRKVWARLRVCRDIRVARKRVLRLMRENNLLSAPSQTVRIMPRSWGTRSGVHGGTAGAGTAVEHWNAECAGSAHVCKRGDRFAALQPISMGLAGLYGSTAAGAARGLALGIQPSYRREANGVRNRRNRSSTAASRSCGTARLRRTLQCPVDRRKERPSSAQARTCTPRSQSGPPRETNLSKEPTSGQPPSQLRPAHGRRAPANRRADPSLCRSQDPGGAVQTRDHALPEALRGPRDLPRPHRPIECLTNMRASGEASTAQSPTRNESSVFRLLRGGA